MENVRNTVNAIDPIQPDKPDEIDRVTLVDTIAQDAISWDVGSMVAKRPTGAVSSSHGDFTLWWVDPDWTGSWRKWSRRQPDLASSAVRGGDGARGWCRLQ